MKLKRIYLQELLFKIDNLIGDDYFWADFLMTMRLHFMYNYKRPKKKKNQNKIFAAEQ